MNLEKRISSKRIYEGNVLNLRVDEVKVENGRITRREVVEHRGAAAIVPILDDGDVILVRQYRYSIQSDLLEIPAGTLQADEEPSDCARRELEEETGYRCGEIVKLLECFVAPGYSTEKIHVFLARNLTKTQTRMDEDEIINVERVKFSEAIGRIRAGQIQDAKSIVGLRAAESLIKG